MASSKILFQHILHLLAFFLSTKISLDCATGLSICTLPLVFLSTDAPSGGPALCPKPLGDDFSYLTLGAELCRESVPAAQGNRCRKGVP